MAPQRLSEQVEKLRAMGPASEAPPAPPPLEPDSAEARELLGAQRWAEQIPRRFSGARLGDFAPALAEPLGAWAAAPEGRNLVCFGPVGTGKTHAACAAARPLIEAGSFCAFWPVVRLLDALRPGGALEDDPYAAAARAPLLILDDLGAEKVSDWTAERLYSIVNDRWLAERPTIATTNTDPRRLPEAAGERLASRLLGGAVILRFSGNDRRINP